MHGTTGAARHIHLTRAARIAGEAFAFAEPETTRGPGARPSVTILVWAGLGIVAAGALLIGF